MSKTDESQPVSAWPGECIHYTGVYSHGTEVRSRCAAGVDYRGLVDGKTEPGWFIRLPCMVRSGVDWMPDDPVECPKFELPDTEQVAEYRTFFERRLHNIIEGLNRCRAHYKSAIEAVGRVPGVFEGCVDCPECAGVLRFWVDPTGGMGGKCDTEECVNFNGCNSRWGGQ